MLNGQREASAEMRLLPRDSTPPKIIRVSARPLLSQEGKVEGVVCISSDITEQKQAESELVIATQQAESANRAKSNFVANMSHEIRTPMNAILGTAELLSRTELVTSQKRYLDMIMLSGKTLLNILNDVLDFSKIEADKMELAPVQFRLNDILHSLGTIMSMAAIKKDVEVVIHVDPVAPPILVGDSHRLHQILVNLVSNAIKFTDTGEVVLSVLCRSIGADAATLCFAVRDTGVGMTAAQQERLFSPFNQADNTITRQFGGSGLGLTISRRLTEMMGGVIELKSCFGQGSEFAAVIPFVIPKGVERRAAPRHSLKNFRLLVIDDNKSAREAIAGHISSWRWTADVVSSDREAFELLAEARSKHIHYDAILLDCQLSGVERETLLKTIREAFSSTPILLMASMYARENISDIETVCGNSSPNNLLTKPITASSLFDALNELFNPAKTESTLLRSDSKNHFELQNIRLLVVEDNEFNQIVARDFLEQAGASVDVVENGQKALDVLRNKPSLYAVILMDVQMPIMDGFTATREIRQSLKLQTPIIAMTAGVTEFERESCIKSGMNDLIAKPIDAAHMIATIKSYTVLGNERRTNQKVDLGLESVAEGDGAFDITKLMNIGANVPDYLQKSLGLIKGLVKNSKTSFEVATAAFTEERYDEVANILHTLRGSLGLVGAISFAEHASRLEESIRNGVASDDLEELFIIVKKDIEQTLSAAEKWIILNSKDQYK